VERQVAHADAFFALCGLAVFLYHPWKDLTCSYLKQRLSPSGFDPLLPPPEESSEALSALQRRGAGEAGPARVGEEQASGEEVWMMPTKTEVLSLKGGFSWLVC